MTKQQVWWKMSKSIMPPNHSCIKCKWVIKIKCNVMYHARLLHIATVMFKELTTPKFIFWSFMTSCFVTAINKDLLLTLGYSSQCQNGLLVWGTWRRNLYEISPWYERHWKRWPCHFGWVNQWTCASSKAVE